MRHASVALYRIIMAAISPLPAQGDKASRRRKKAGDMRDTGGVSFPPCGAVVRVCGRAGHKPSGAGAAQQRRRRKGGAAAQENTAAGKNSRRAMTAAYAGR